MSFLLECYLRARQIAYDTDLDYRLTQLELYELGADDDIILEFTNLWDEGVFFYGKFKKFVNKIQKS